MLQLHVPDEKDAPSPPSTVARFNQPLVGKQMRTKLDGSGAAGDSTNMQNPLVSLAAYAVASFVPSPLGGNGDRGLASAVSAARDQRSLCVALADAEKLAFARGVEIQLLQRELARAEQLQQHLGAELASARELSARVSDGAEERVRMLSEARAATASSESAATSLRNEHALLHEEVRRSMQTRMCSYCARPCSRKGRRCERIHLTPFVFFVCVLCPSLVCVAEICLRYVAS